MLPPAPTGGGGFGPISPVLLAHVISSGPLAPDVSLGIAKMGTEGMKHGCCEDLIMCWVRGDPQNKGGNPEATHCSSLTPSGLGKQAKSLLTSDFEVAAHSSGRHYPVPPYGWVLPTMWVSAQRSSPSRQPPLTHPAQLPTLAFLPLSSQPNHQLKLSWSHLIRGFRAHPSLPLQAVEERMREGPVHGCTSRSQSSAQPV